MRIRPFPGTRVLSAVFFSLFAANAAIADDYYQQALEHYENAETRPAIIQLKNLLQQTPTHREGRLLLGQIYLDEKQFPAAEKELRRALELGTPPEDVAASMATALIGLQRYQDALAFIEKLWKTGFGSQAQRWTLIGEAHLGLHALEQARQAFTQSLAVEESPEATLGLARVSGAEGKTEEALRWVASITEPDTLGIQATLLHAELLLAKGDGASALNILSPVFEAAPENPLVRLRYAQAALLAGKSGLASEITTPLLTQAPQRPEVLLTAALSALSTQDYSAAKAHATMLLPLAPGNLQGRLIAGIASYHLNQLEDAAGHLNAVLDQAPGQPLAIRFMAATLLKQNKAKDVVGLLEPFISSGIKDAALAALTGSAYLRMGDWERAESFLSEAKETLPDSGQLVNQIALGRLLSGREGEALDLLDQHSEATSFQSDVIRLAALVQEDEIEKARSLLQSRIAADSDSISYRLLLASFELRQGNMAAGRAALEAAEKVAPQHPGPQLELARLELLNKQPEKAEQRYRKIIHRQPDHLSALLGLSTVSKLKGDTREVTHWLQLAREKNPDAVLPAQYLVNHFLLENQQKKALSEAQAFYMGRENREDAALLYASTLRACGSLERSETILQQLLATHPDYSPALATVAEVLRDQGRAEEGVKYSARLYELSPTALPAVQLHAGLLMQVQEDDRAFEILESSWAQQPSTGVARRLGILEARRGKWQSAKQYFAYAHQGAIDSQLLQMMLEVERRLNGTEGMHALLDQRLSAAPTDAFARMQLAMLYQEQNETDKAIQQYEHVKGLQPDNAAIWNNLAWLYFNAGDKRSLSHAQEAYRLAPDSPSVQDTLGWILLNEGDKEKGLEMLSLALKQLSDNAEVRFHHATALAANQQTQEARSALLRLSEEQTPFQPEIEALLQRLH